MQEEKDSSDSLRKKICDLRNALSDKRKEHEELLIKLKVVLEPYTDSFDTFKRIRDLEIKLSEKQIELNSVTTKNKTLQSEKMALEADCSRLRTKVTDLVERATKMKSEDWKRLENERETLVNVLNKEKANVKKLNTKLDSVKIVKAKLVKEYIELSGQQNNLLDENKKLSEEVQMLKDDLSRSIEELTKTKAQFTVITELNNKLTEDLINKDASLSDIRNRVIPSINNSVDRRVIQIRKIAKKYKTQYEDLVKAVQEEKKKAESEESSKAVTESIKRLKEEINEIKTKLEKENKNNENIQHGLKILTKTSLHKEETSEQVLKQAKVIIVQPTEKNRELDESRTNLGAMEQCTRDEQGALTQKVTVLHRQLASQVSAAKQQVTTEKTTADPPTANMKPLAGSSREASTLAAGSARASKRSLLARALISKRKRVQGSDRSLQVGHQVPTLSRYHQDEEEVIVIDSENDDEPCTGAMYRESPVQLPVASEAVEATEAGDAGKVGGSRQAAPQPDSGLHLPTPQIEAISSGTEPSGTLSLGGCGGGSDEGDDSIVPSTTTLYVPRRNGGIGEVTVSLGGGSSNAGAGGSGTRSTFAESSAEVGASAASVPEEDSSAVRTWDNESSSPRQMAEAGRGAEPPVPRRYLHVYSNPNRRRMLGNESSVRGRGERPRGRTLPHPHEM